MQEALSVLEKIDFILKDILKDISNTKDLKDFSNAEDVTSGPKCRGESFSKIWQNAAESCGASRLLVGFIKSSAKVGLLKEAVEDSMKKIRTEILNQENKQECLVVTAGDIDQKTVEQIKLKIEGLLGVETVLTFIKKPEIIGGFIIKTKSRALDMSRRTQIKHAMKVIKEESTKVDFLTSLYN